MHYMYVEPTRAKADIVINSGKNDVAKDMERRNHAYKQMRKRAHQ